MFPAAAVLGCKKPLKPMTRLDEIKSKMADLIDAAYENGAAVTATEYETKLFALQQKYDAAIASAQPSGTQTSQSQPSDTQASPSQPSLAGDTIPLFPLTNPAVAALMADPAYIAPGFATSDQPSVVTRYTHGILAEGDYAANWPEHPLPVSLPSGRQVFNLIPGRQYHLPDDDGATLSLRTSGTVRQIHFPDPATAVPNCRDLGGYKAEGRHVRYGKVIRSARLPEGLTKNSPTAAVLRDDIGVTLEIDLRGFSAYNTLGWAGVKYGISGYASLLTKTANLKAVFTRILAEVEKPGGCVLIHCSAGADRTGTVAALLLGLLGVSEADIIRDWELTSFCHWCNFKVIGQWEERLNDPKMHATALQEFPTGELREFFRKMQATYGPSGQSFQQQVTAFLTRKVGLTTAQLSRLKKALIE